MGTSELSHMFYILCLYSIVLSTGHRTTWSLQPLHALVRCFSQHFHLETSSTEEQRLLSKSNSSSAASSAGWRVMQVSVRRKIRYHYTQPSVLRSKGRHHERGIMRGALVLTLGSAHCWSYHFVHDFLYAVQTANRWQERRQHSSHQQEKDV
jgi:hypothetical protein